MAINLNTLTSPATSGDVLAEALTTADFLEGVPVLRNLARGSQKGGDAKQDVALNQPKALPLDANGKGYCYLPVTTGNAPAVTFPTIGSSADFVLEMDVYIVNPLSFYLVSGASHPHRFLIDANRFYFQDGTPLLSSALVAGASTIKIERSSGTITLRQDGALKASGSDSGSYDFTHLSFNGQFSTSGPPLNGYIQTATLSIGGTEQLNIDFTATNVRHGDTKFACATNQVVTINQSGNDPATIIKKPVLRFDGTNDGLQGLFANDIDGGYMFAAFSVLGSGGEAWGRVFSTNSSGGGEDDREPGAAFSIRNSSTTDLHTRFKLATASLIHVGMFDDANGDILHESKIQNGSQSSKINNANLKTESHTIATASDEFNIGSYLNPSLANAAIDLEYLALFPATITDDQADSVRNYINNRNNVFDLKDGFGYYFYDAQNAPVGAISSGSSSWNGRIIGSDNGDTDKLATQATANHQPVSDGFKVTFADNTDHLDIPSTSQAGWQIVGTSLGTFAYRVNANAQVRLNLLGYRGSASYRFAGDLYGIILLPESATGADIEAARKLLIDRGAFEGFTGSSLYAAWYQRGDIVEFKGVPMPYAANIGYSFASQTALASFPAMSFPAVTFAGNAWQGNTSMSSFGAIQAPLCSNFSSAWQGCSALTSFPAGAKLGTAASNVNFTSAWQSSGLTSFEVDLSTGTTFTNTFRSSALTSFGGCDLSKGIHFKNTFYLCSNLTQISASVKFGTAAVNVDFDSAFASTGLTSFPALDLSNGTKFYATWFGNNSMSEFGAIDARLGNTFADAFKNCSALTSFPSEAKLGTNANDVVFSETWRSNGLTSFSTPLNTGAYFFRTWRDCSSLVDFSAEVLTNWNPSSITTGVFNEAWDGCSALTAQSVENILTSINASGQYATTNGASGGTALGDAGIDIDYNVSTGSLSAATNSAVTSLKSKGWSIIVNNVTL